MSFFKDFKDDLSLAVNELLPGEDLENELDVEGSADRMVNTLEDELDIESELSKLDGLLEPVQAKEEPKPVKPAAVNQKQQNFPNEAKEQPRQKRNVEDEVISRLSNGLDLQEKESGDVHFSFDAKVEEPEPEPQPSVKNMIQNSTIVKEEVPMNEEMVKETIMGEELSAETPEITDEVSIITSGTNIKGNLSTTGSFSISGRVEGNVQCNGKLEVTGVIKGNSSSSEVFSDAAKIEGEISSTGTVKIGLGSIVIGNISATSAVIAGAVKGDIDVQGPVVVDTSAVIVGNIKSRSVQINNGAVIEGFCSQCYADIDVESLFGDKKGK